MAKYFNTAYSLSMHKFPFQTNGVELSAAEAAAWLQDGDVSNVANPNHANTLAALTQKLGLSVMDAKGGRVVLEPGDQLLVGQVSFPADVPRETMEYSDEQLAKGRFSFGLISVS